ncbi:MAG TPA: nucleotidyltransferase family protein [Terriglobia bacterium]|nr:nucleotidyltransferase family protein [Terriglobia bacterium]
MPRSLSRAFLLAAGLGTRLRPLTEKLPKCLVPIGGEPLLSIWIGICASLGIESVLINTHHGADEVSDWARSQDSQVAISLAHEETLRGSAGTLSANREFVRDAGDFYVFYADNLVHADLPGLRSFHASHDGVVTLGLFRATKPQECGIVTLDDAGRVLKFEEKPAHPASDLANAGIFIARQSLFDLLPTRSFADFGKDVMPGLTGAPGGIWGYVLDGYIRDIGTIESYQEAQREWPRVIRGESWSAPPAWNDAAGPERIGPRSKARAAPEI